LPEGTEQTTMQEENSLNDAYKENENVVFKTYVQDHK
jgi:hypothetical protein